MTEAQFELMLGAFREQHNELRAIHEAALGKLRGISYALYIILELHSVRASQGQITGYRIGEDQSGDNEAILQPVGRSLCSR
jgi:hypothetical protein